MKKDTIKLLKNSSSFREKAETQLGKYPKIDPYLTESEARKLAHELEVHEIELEMLNEQLVLSNDETRIVSEKFTALYDFAPVGYFTIEHDGTICELNIAGAKLLGKERSSLMGRNFKLFLSTSTLKIFNDFLQKIFEGKTKEACEVQLANNGNFSIFLHVDGVFLHSKSKYLVSTTDITERKKAENQIVRMNSVLFAISYISQLITREKDAKLLLDKACDILYKTRGYILVWVGVIEEGHKRVIPAARTGKDADYLDEITITWDESDTGKGPTGTAIRTCKPQVCKNIATDPNFAPWRDAAMRRGYASSFVAPMMHNERLLGTLNVYSGTIDFFSDDEMSLLCELANSLALGLFSIENDKKRKEAETKLKQYSENLEAQVKERTAELEAFTYSISHDLRTPLRAMNGFSQIIIEDFADKLGEEGRRQLNVITQSAVKMSELIDGLLALSRLGGSQLSISNINMKTLVSETIENLKSSMDKSRTAHFEIGELPDASGDASMIRQVFVNILDNAVKFTRNVMKARIEAGGYEENEENVYYVKDNGAGFDAKYTDTLFIIFHRLHSTEEFEGTGIGLAIIKRIITRHGGRVWAEGKIGEGATFYFTLPKK